uniref:Uncharacterized protein n=1 Tax=Arundo donax TaxID=35708 RepID=A0A0A9GGB0_ARUDO
MRAAQKPTFCGSLQTEDCPPSGITRVIPDKCFESFKTASHLSYFVNMQRIF